MMRKGYNGGFWKENGELLGINLGADFTAEHEWGINMLLKRLNVLQDLSLFGIKKRKINSFPKEHTIFTKCTFNNVQYSVLIFGVPCLVQKINEMKIEKIIPSDLVPCKNDDLVCAWDEKSFGILVSEKYEKELNKIYNAFLNNDIAIGIAPSHAFNNGGLKFTIISKIPKKYIDEIYKNDIDNFNLQQTAINTGIYKILEKEDKKYYALSPKWKNVNKKEVIFWLNPQDQDKYNYGWFTVADLKEWAENKGKIMKVGIL